jgi:hypothetical protein
MMDYRRNKSESLAYRNWLYPVAAMSIVIQFALVLWPENSKNAYEIDAVRWVQGHATAGSRIYFDSGRLTYYATGDSSSRKKRNLEEMQRDFSTTAMQQYDYMLVHASRKKPEIEKFLLRQTGTPPIAQFDNGRDDRVLIFRVR